MWQEQCALRHSSSRCAIPIFSSHSVQFFKIFWRCQNSVAPFAVPPSFYLHRSMSNCVCARVASVSIFISECWGCRQERRGACTLQPKADESILTRFPYVCVCATVEDGWCMDEMEKVKMPAASASAATMSFVRPKLAFYEARRYPMQSVTMCARRWQWSEMSTVRRAKHSIYIAIWSSCAIVLVLHNHNTRIWSLKTFQRHLSQRPIVSTFASCRFVIWRYRRKRAMRSKSKSPH